MPDLQRRDVRPPDGLRLSSLAGRNPHGPAVLLLHGLGEQAASWAAVAEPEAFTEALLAWLGAAP